MREILFRGKRLDNGEWVEGYLYEHEPALVGIASENDVPETSKWFIARTGFADWNLPRPVEFVEIDPSTVGQYTGLKDKNGKRIFEGDIVKAQDEILGSPFCDGINGKVVYDEAAYFIELKDPMNSQWLYDECAVYEIIGNIHDNPELLEK